MSDLAHLCYPANNDTLVEISRHYGFFRQEKAAQAKVEIVQGLTALIQSANGTVEGKINPTSSRWWYNTDSLTALVHDTELEISIGARHKEKATQSLPCAGIFSELAVSIFTYQNPQQFMNSPLAAEMKNISRATELRELFNPYHFQILGRNGLDLKLLMDGTG